MEGNKLWTLLKIVITPQQQPEPVKSSLTFSIYTAQVILYFSSSGFVK